MYRLAAKRAGKKRVEENASLRFFETHNQACTASMVVLSSVIRSLSKLCSVTLE